MEVYNEAKSLHQQLVQLQHCDKIISKLDREISRLNEQSIISSIKVQQCKHLCLLLRQSITDGVYLMYQQYSTNKWNQIQTTARSIKSQLESHDQDSTTTTTTASTTVRSQPDKAIDQWSSVFCEISRHE